MTFIVSKGMVPISLTLWEGTDKITGSWIERELFNGSAQLCSLTELPDLMHVYLCSEAV